MKKLFLIPLMLLATLMMATPMQSFLRSHADLLAGKQIALFASSGSSGISTSVNEARELVPEASFTETLHLTRNTLEDMGSRIPEWLEELSQGTENINIRFERQ